MAKHAYVVCGFRRMVVGLCPALTLAARSQFGATAHGYHISQRVSWLQGMLCKQMCLLAVHARNMSSCVLWPHCRPRRTCRLRLHLAS